MEAQEGCWFNCHHPHFGISLFCIYHWCLTNTWWLSLSSPEVVELIESIVQLSYGKNKTACYLCKDHTSLVSSRSPASRRWLRALELWWQQGGSHLNQEIMTSRSTCCLLDYQGSLVVCTPREILGQKAKRVSHLNIQHFCLALRFFSSTTAAATTKNPCLNGQFSSSQKRKWNKKHSKLKLIIFIVGECHKKLSHF